MPDVPVLCDLAARINTEHDAARNALDSALEHARTAGNLLLKAKAELRHGNWFAWLDANCVMSRRTAQLYMRVAREWPRIADRPETQRVAHLPLRGVLKAIEHAKAIEVGPGPTLSAVSDVAPSPSSTPVTELDGRRCELAVSPDKQRFLLVILPNDAGRSLDEHLAELRECDELYRAEVSEADAMDGEADALLEEAEALQRRAETIKAEAQARRCAAGTYLREEAARRWGHAYNYVETIDYELNEPTRAVELQKLPKSEAIHRMLSGDPLFRETGRGYWGDIMRMDAKDWRPSANGWTGVGSIDGIGLPRELMIQFGLIQQREGAADA